MKKYLKIIIILFLALVLIVFYILLRKQQSFNNYSNNMFSINSVFLNKTKIPDQYGCHGEDINPPLEFHEIPEGAKSLVLIIDDPDAPSGDWVHWLIFNINPQTTTIAEHSIPKGAIVGVNSFGENIYEGPCPPSGTHHYNFKLYAIDTVLNLGSKVEKSDVLAAIKGHIIAQTILTGTYNK